MPIRVLINGASGKMGQATCKALGRSEEFLIVAETNSQHDLATEIKQHKPQVVVDFTTANVGVANLQTIIDADVHPVIGTTGFLPADIQRFQKLCAEKKLGGIIAPNFSLGAVLMMKLAPEIAKYFENVEIIEMHHDKKLDSPSGTAMRTAEMIASERKTTSDKKPQKETIEGSRGASHHNIPIHALRLPGLVAHQQVIFGGVGETLTIKHDSIDREAFMPGVLLSCKKVLKLNELVYGLENIL